MKRKTTLAAYMLCGLAAGTMMGSIRAESNFDILLGTKSLDDGDWSAQDDFGKTVEIDKQREFGILLSVGRPEWPVQIAVHYLITETDDDGRFVDSSGGTVVRNIKGKTKEFDLGVRKSWRTQRRLRPFVGGGGTYLSAEIETAGLSDDDFAKDDEGMGFWVDGGAFARIGKHLNLGLEARFSKAEVDILFQNIEAGGLHVGLLLGFGK